MPLTTFAHAGVARAEFLPFRRRALIYRLRDFPSSGRSVLPTSQTSTTGHPHWPDFQVHQSAPADLRTERKDKPMKHILILMIAAAAAIGQTGTATIAGAVLDAKTQKPIPAARIIAVASGLPPLSKNSKSGSDGTFQIQGLAAGKYSLCVQAPGDQYLDPCQWSGSPAAVTLASGQAVNGLLLKLTAASLLTIQVHDAQKVLSQKTKDGRRPDLTIGVWGPNGLYYPAHASGGPPAAPNSQSAAGSYAYQLAVPRDIGLKFHIASRDLKLGDAAGAALPANASQQAFQHATGDANPKSFEFTVLGLLP
jgi:hypothetical protein